MKKLILFSTILLLACIMKAQPGTLDLTFNASDIGNGYGNGANNAILTSVVQQDGKIVIGGSFTAFNSQVRNGIARLNTNGTIDTTFSILNGANGTIDVIALQTDGKILVGGQFSIFNEEPHNRILRLNIDGTIDQNFNKGLGAASAVRAIKVQPDGKIIIGGQFTNFNGTACNRIARLNTDGSIDQSFNLSQGVNNTIHTIAIQADGKILIGGKFTNIDGKSANRIARLHADGTFDNTFNTAIGANNLVKTIAIQADAKIIVGGAFTRFNNVNVGYIVRLQTNGIIDQTFSQNTAANNTVESIIVKTDGSILIAGAFTTYNLTTRNRITLLTSNGKIDDRFNPELGANNAIFTLSEQPNGKIIFGGNFSAFNTIRRNNIGRLYPDGTLDHSFNHGTAASNSIRSISLQSNGKIVIGGEFQHYNNLPVNKLTRLNTDGSIDDSFNPNAGVKNGIILSTLVLADGKIMVGGFFDSINNTPLRNLAKLTADGSIDPSFDIGIGPNNIIRAIAEQTDGKIVIGGQFTSVNGQTKNFLARLNANGSLDPSFVTGIGPNNVVHSIAIQPDGKILIGGNFSAYNGTVVYDATRLNPNGSVDPSFNSGFSQNASVNSIAVKADGKIVIGGNFTNYNNTMQNHIVQLNNNGSIDNKFTIGNGFNGTINALVVQNDAKILAIGGFTNFNNQLQNRIVRLNANGSIDQSFNSGNGANETIHTIALQNDANIIVGGNFTNFQNLGRNRIARINGGNICKIPTNLFSTQINPTGATLEWTENSTATQWQITYGEAGFNPSMGTTVTVNTNPYSLSGLIANTNYDFYVRSICGIADTSAWSVAGSFNTPLLLQLNSNHVTNICRLDSMHISFNAEGFNQNNVFTIQLSDSIGSFANPTVLGSLTSNTSGFINVAIPVTVSVGSSYTIRVRASNPAITSFISNAFSIGISCNQITTQLEEVDCGRNDFLLGGNAGHANNVVFASRGISGVLNYLFHVYDLSGNSQIGTIITPNRFFVPSDYNYFVAGGQYQVRVQIENDAGIGPLGNACFIGFRTNPMQNDVPIVNISTTACNSEKYNLVSTQRVSGVDFVNVVKNNVVSNYEFEIWDENQTILLANLFVPSGNLFLRNHLNIFNFGAKYQIRVRAYMGSIAGFWSTFCSISVLPEPIVLPTTQIRANMCGTSLFSVEGSDQGIADVSGIDFILAERVLGVTGYEFEIWNQSQTIMLGLIQTNTSGKFYLRDHNNIFNWNTTYQIRVRTSLTNQKSAWSNFCTISTQPNPIINGVPPTKLRQCNQTLTTNFVRAESVIGASQYRFAFYTDAACNQIYTIAYSQVNLNLSNLPNTLLPGQTYFVITSANIGNVWSNTSTGDTCRITTMTAIPRLTQSVGNKNSIFVLNAYPNPFVGNASVVVNSNSETTALLQVFDLTGRLVQSQEVVTNNAIQIGERIAVGSYVLVATLPNGLRTTFKLVKTD